MRRRSGVTVLNFVNRFNFPAIFRPNPRHVYPYMLMIRLGDEILFTRKYTVWSHLIFWGVSEWECVSLNGSSSVPAVCLSGWATGRSVNTALLIKNSTSARMPRRQAETRSLSLCVHQTFFMKHIHMLTIIFQRRYIIITLFWFCRIKISEFQKNQIPNNFNDWHSFFKKGPAGFLLLFWQHEFGCFLHSC